MTSTPGEFVGSLVAAFPGAVATDQNCLTVTHGEARLQFEIQVGKSWCIGSLQLPRLLVNITVLDGDEEAVAALLDRVDRATQRGGG